MLAELHMAKYTPVKEGLVMHLFNNDGESMIQYTDNFVMT